MVVLSKTYRPDLSITIYQVALGEDGLRLDQYLLLQYPNFSRQLIKDRIITGQVVIKGRASPHRPSAKVHEGDQVTVTFLRSSEEDEWWNGRQIPTNAKPSILFEDDDLIVISKPAFMTTHPTGKHLFNCATVFCEEYLGHSICSIHRLDRETSGVLMIAKNPKTAQEITAKFERSEIKKCYFFIAKINHQKFNGEKSFVANERLDPGQEEFGPKRVMIDYYPQDSSDGKHAKTFFRLLRIKGDYALGLAFPQTGRQHQIRVHAMAHGLPLLGDKIYLGGYDMFTRFKDRTATPEDHALMEIPRQALHAYALRLTYQEEQKTFIAPLPSDLLQWMEKMEISLVDSQNIEFEWPDQV